MTGLVSALWGMAALVAVAGGFPAGFWVELVLAASGLYAVGLSVWHGVARGR